MPTHTSSIYLLLLLFSAFYLDKNIVLDDYVITYQIWDTAGQERFHSLLPGFVRGAQIALVVYDVTNPVGRRLFFVILLSPSLVVFDVAQCYVRHLHLLWLDMLVLLKLSDLLV